MDAPQRQHTRSTHTPWASLPVQPTQRSVIRTDEYVVRKHNTHTTWDHQWDGTKHSSIPTGPLLRHQSSHGGIGKCSVSCPVQFVTTAAIEVGHGGLERVVPYAPLLCQQLVGDLVPTLLLAYPRPLPPSPYSPRSMAPN